MLVCRDASAEIDFCQQAFDAEELSRRVAKDGSVIHATMKIGDAMFMVHGEASHLASNPPQQDGSSAVVIYLYSNEVDPIIEQAVAAGARVLLPAENQLWGDRVGRILDPAGHVWNIAARTLEKEI
ncbi:MAG: VOC family protein [Verrucomicrobia bacterium]|nr:VOC family protein [Verrucomicrobiota bacterium]